MQSSAFKEEQWVSRVQLNERGLNQPELAQNLGYELMMLVMTVILNFACQ